MLTIRIGNHKNPFRHPSNREGWRIKKSIKSAPETEIHSERYSPYQFSLQHPYTEHCSMDWNWRASENFRWITSDAETFIKHTSHWTWIKGLKLKLLLLVSSNQPKRSKRHIFYVQISQVSETIDSPKVQEVFFKPL